MKNTLQQQAPADEQPQEKTLVLKYWNNKPRGTMDVSHQYGLAMADGIEAYCKQNGYVRLQDLQSGIVELYDRGESEGMYDRFLIAVHVRNPGQPRYLIAINVPTFDLIMLLVHDDLLSCLPLLPDMLRRYHGISV